MAWIRSAVLAVFFLMLYLDKQKRYGPKDTGFELVSRTPMHEPIRHAGTTPDGIVIVHSTTVVQQRRDRRASCGKL